MNMKYAHELPVCSLMDELIGSDISTDISEYIFPQISILGSELKRTIECITRTDVYDKN